jgi:hypothetical protein
VGNQPDRDEPLVATLVAAFALSEASLPQPRSAARRDRSVSDFGLRRLACRLASSFEFRLNLFKGERDHRELANPFRARARRGKLRARLNALTFDGLKQYERRVLAAPGDFMTLAWARLIKRWADSGLLGRVLWNGPPLLPAS